MDKTHSSGVDPLLLKLAADVRRLRKAKGLSQEALALVADVDRTYVSQLERCVANPSLVILQRIAQALGVSLAIEWHETAVGSD
jgi:transcriptional regulator with XRE-family HTH domain